MARTLKNRGSAYSVDEFPTSGSWLKGSIQAAEAALPHLRAALKAWQQGAPNKHICFGNQVWDGSVQGGLNQLIGRWEEILQVMKDFEEKKIDIFKISDQVIKLLDDAKCECRERTAIKDRVLRHYG